MSSPSHRDDARTGDELLAVRCQLGEPEAFDDLIARWHGPLWSFVRRLAGEDELAHDTLQDVWLRVLRGIASLRDGARLRAWLFGIARRAVMDRLRRKYRDAWIVDDDVDALAAEDDSWPSPRDLDALQDRLTRLPIAERELLTLFYLRELSLAELAEVLAIPVGTVKSRLFRARALLREQLTAQGVDR
jgi:RNA polymerase sigma factor (sigma-70 family)